MIKLFYPFIIVLSIISCKSQQIATKNNPITENSSICPEDGICEFEVIKGKKLNMLQDEFGTRYPEIVDGSRIILKFEYKRNLIPDTADSHYNEIIYLELDPKNIELKKQGEELKYENLYFGRICFCRGQTGYYKITEGMVSVSKISENTYLFDLEFTTDEVPQVITKVSESFSL